ncbi:6462_t:CDS:2, partial [Racocetra fulgida]
TTAAEFDTSEEMNQVTSIRGHNAYQASIHTSITEKQEYAHGFGIAKSGLKFALENGLVNEFVGLIVKFIENHSGVATSEHITKLKHKRRSRLLDSAQQNEIEAENEYTEELLPKKRVNTVNDENSTSKVEGRYYSNCYGTGHYANTCKFPTVNGENSTSK